MRIPKNQLRINIAISAATFVLTALYLADKKHHLMLIITAIFLFAGLAVYNVYTNAKRKSFSGSATIGKFPMLANRPIQADFSESGIKAVVTDPKIADKVRLGKNYYLGRTFPKDYSKAFEILFECALAGDAEAQTMVGTMFLHGQGIRQDENNAKIWLEAASFQGSADAQYQLGRLYDQRRDSSETIIKAFHFLRSSAEKGHTEGQIRLKEISREPAMAKYLSVRVPSSSCFSVEANPFIKALCIDQSSKTAKPQINKKIVESAFKVFGLPTSSDQQTVRRKYLDMMLRCHPDRSSSAASGQQVLKIRKAYDTLDQFFTMTGSTK